MNKQCSVSFGRQRAAGLRPAVAPGAGRILGHQGTHVAQRAARDATDARRRGFDPVESKKRWDPRIGRVGLFADSWKLLGVLSSKRGQ